MPQKYTIEAIQQKAIHVLHNIKTLELTPDHWEKIVEYFNTHNKLAPTSVNLLAIIAVVTDIPDVCERLSKRNPARTARKSTSPYPPTAMTKAARDRFFRSHPSTRSDTPTLVAQGTPQSPITPRKNVLINNGVPVTPLKDVNTPTKHPVPLKQHLDDDDKSHRVYLVAKIGAPNQPDKVREIYTPYTPAKLLPTESSLGEVLAQLPNLHYRPIKPVSMEVSAKSIHQAQHNPPRRSLNNVTGVSCRRLFKVSGKADLLDDSRHPAHWGHAVARVFNGPDLPHNLMPQTAISNMRSTWSMIESPLRDKLLANPKIAALYTVTPSYVSDESSLIPTNIQTEVTVRSNGDDPESPTTIHQFNVDPRSNKRLTHSDIDVFNQLWELDDESVPPQPLLNTI